MATLKFDKITAEQVTVEVPAFCPSCGADFCEEDAIREHGYVGSTWWGSIVDNEYDNGDNYEDCADVCYTTGYECAKCGHALAGTSA